MSNKTEQQEIFCVWNEEFYPISETVALNDGKYVHKDYYEAYIQEYFFVCAYDQNLYSRDVMVQAEDGQFVHKLNLNDYESETSDWRDEGFNKTIYGIS